MKNTAQAVFGVIELFEEFVQDGFITEQITVAFDRDDTEDIQVVRGDFRSYFNAYEYVIMLGEGDTIEDIEQEIERIDLLRETIGY